MFRRVAATLSASVALSAAGLLAAAPLASADPVTTDDDNDVGIALLNDLTVLPVQACGVDAGVPILSNVLGGADAAPSDVTCAVVDEDDDVDD
jgi:hypothetical protein